MMPNNFVQASNGIRYVYRRFGEGDGVPLVLLSHFRANLDMWDPLLIDEIAKKRPVIQVDNVGIGLSSGRVPDSVEEMARDMLAFIQALRLPRVDVLGFSVGGFVAQELAISSPNLVRRVVLAGTAPRGAGDDVAVGTRVHSVTTKDVIGLKDLLFLFFAPTPISREKGVEFIRRLGHPRPEADRMVSEPSWRAQFEAAKKWKAADPLALAGLSRLKQPTLVAHGEFDVMITLARARALADNMPNADLRIFPDAGHAFLFQEPEAFGSLVVEFLSANHNRREPSAVKPRRSQGEKSL
jgi:pimeloyl-ACP methyl ester carboxylesterase